ncbi:hypothetical protein DIURU_002687 [Diutina rugosa]|uniref:Sterol 3-beta-glucosyltransferase n=1 Tax=Diutina rugosa TaxID=5481 RepID=A0A642UP45_DIURU|nr:uncharacterized protein DIURU_002687 [Diutina rugosa]KAA8902791.1 hypothetical protein DIURU_002687 [Diutina rugosa]
MAEVSTPSEDSVHRPLHPRHLQKMLHKFAHCEDDRQQASEAAPRAPSEATSATVTPHQSSDSASVTGVSTPPRQPEQKSSASKPMFQRWSQVVSDATGAHGLSGQLRGYSIDSDTDSDEDDFASSESQGNFLMNFLTSACNFGGKHLLGEPGSPGSSSSGNRHHNHPLKMSYHPVDPNQPLHTYPRDGGFADDASSDNASMATAHYTWPEYDPTSGEPTKPGEAPHGHQHSPTQSEMDYPTDKPESTPVTQTWPMTTDGNEPPAYSDYFAGTEMPAELTPLQRSFIDHFDLSYVSAMEFATKIKTDRPAQRTCELIQVSMADRVKQVFDLDDNDRFIGNSTAWLIHNVMLQGHVHLTDHCLLYFGFLPKRNLVMDHDFVKDDDAVDIVQMGPLGMRQSKYGEAMVTSLTTHRYWGVLRLETLSIYSSSTDFYFPRVIINLKSIRKVEILEHEKLQPKRPDGLFSPKSWLHSRSGSGTASHPESRSVSASATDSEESDDDVEDMEVPLSVTEDNTEAATEGVWIKLSTKKKTYKFHCDNIYSAREWVNNIQKCVFRLRNANAAEEVIVKIPLANIVSIKGDDLLVGSKEDDERDPHEPRNVVIYYVSTHHKKHHRDDQKVHQRDTRIESITLVFFRNAAAVIDLLQRTWTFSPKPQSHVHNMEETKRDRFFRRAKQMVSQDEHAYSQTMSTLSDNHGHDYILDQLEYTSQFRAEFDAVTSAHNSDDEDDAKSSSKFRKFSHKLLSRFSDEPLHPQKEVAPEGSPSSPAYPKPLTLESLRRLGMTFTTRLKDPQCTSLEYQMQLQRNQMMKEGQCRTSVPAMGLSDPSTYDDQARNNHKENRFAKKIKVVSGMHNFLTSNPSHYFPSAEHDQYFVANEQERDESLRRFREHFAASKESELIASYYVYMKKGTVPVYGKLYLGSDELCFRSMLIGVSTKMVLPLRKIENVNIYRDTFKLHHSLEFTLAGARSFEVELGSEQARDDAYSMIMTQLSAVHADENWEPQDHDWAHNSSDKAAQSRKKQDYGPLHREDYDYFNQVLEIDKARVKMFEDKLAAASGMDIPFMLEDSPMFMTEVRSAKPMKITFLTIGSRGDVQPYIALGKGLLREGHQVTIATHHEFGDWIRKHNMGFREIAGNPAELMDLMVSHGSMSVGFLKDAKAKFGEWLKELLFTSWRACQGCDLLIESPSAMAGIHIAEALGVPYMRAFTMPWTRTRAYPQAFMVPDSNKGGSYNYLTHVMFEGVFWKAMSGYVNRWRVNELNLPRTNMYRMAQNSVPFLYNVSPTVLPPALDFPDWVKVTGYWFLDEGGAKDYDPPKELIQFMKNARDDDKKIVYIGFGSIVVKDASKMTKAVIEAVLEADVRCILNKGWSDRLSKEKKPEIQLPPEIYNAGSIPHDWLFPKIDAAVHHGGSGTTGATMKAGIPTIIKPFFGDQFFYAMRLEAMGVGIELKKLTSKSLTEAIIKATSDVKMIERVRKVSDNISREFGVMTAIKCIYNQMEYARNLIAIKQLYAENYKKHTPDWREEEDGWDESDEEAMAEAREEVATAAEEDDEATLAASSQH